MLQVSWLYGTVIGHKDFVCRWSVESYIDYWQNKIDEAKSEIEFWELKKAKALEKQFEVEVIPVKENK